MVYEGEFGRGGAENPVIKEVICRKSNGHLAREWQSGHKALRTRNFQKLTYSVDKRYQSMVSLYYRDYAIDFVANFYLLKNFARQGGR
jgi:uncharacterized protein YggL (DUF469 family)